MKTVQSIGRYRVDGLLGTGAMGEVYRAYDPVIDRPVAIKIVRTELAAGSGSEQWLQRFRREARAAGRRFHPNIVAILDFGEDDGMPFLAMEYVDGRSLDAILKTSGPLDPARSVSIITQVLSALGFAHQNGIVHRDIKPSNIMVLNSGEVKVADFGIARIDASEFTIVGDLLGTPAYMAPEQFAGAPVDKRTDLFAAGVILFEMLTGVKPFRGKSITEIISFMENRGPEDIRALNPAVPDSLKRVITKALAFDPARRYDNAAEFSKAIIEAFPVRLDQRPIPEPPVSSHRRGRHRSRGDRAGRCNLASRPVARDRARSGDIHRPDGGDRAEARNRANQRRRGTLRFAGTAGGKPASSRRIPGTRTVASGPGSSRPSPLVATITAGECI